MARLAACQSGPDAAERTATFTGSMPAIKGTTRMWMRFDLQQRTPPAVEFLALKAPGLGVWQKSAPGRASGFVFKQRVQALAAPGAYKAVVRFRWYGKRGLLRSTARETGICRQPDQATYSLIVLNGGHTAAGPFDVGLAVAGIDQPRERVAGGLAPGASQTLTFVAPLCAPGTTLRFALDARGEVHESAEADDVVEWPCPFTA
jgi:CARDB